MAKPRVHELAKELGITSKEAISTLQTLGEFVRGASSTVEPPVAKKLRSALAGRAEKSAPAAPAPAGKPASKPGASSRPGTSAPAPGPAAAKPA
ncbi:translation initiation factor IF-2, partial [Kocuria rosea]